jgi:RNA polymerase primary sigma factor
MANQYVNDFSTTVKTYYDELKRYKPITRAKEKELICKAKNGDINAQNEILTANLRFVFNVASRYKGNGAAISDLISEGNLGLVKAIQKFDPNKDVKFISYAVWWVRNAMQEFIKKRQTILNVEKEEESLNIVVGDGNIKDGEDDYVIKKEVILSNEEDEEKRELQKNQKKIVDKILSILSEREKYIVEEYYGINGKKEKNLEEIGNELGITKERVRQIKQVSLNKLRSEILLIEGADFIFK